MISREVILAAAGKKAPVAVAVPEWGGEVFLRVMTARERDAYEAEMCGQGGAGKINYDNFRARLVARCLCDESGTRLFSDADIPALGESSAPVIRLLFDEAQRINGMTVAEVEDLRKNS